MNHPDLKTLQKLKNTITRTDATKDDIIKLIDNLIGLAKSFQESKNSFEGSWTKKLNQ